MKEWIVNLHPIGGGLPTKTRVFSGNQSSVIKIAKEQNPKYRTGSVKLVN